MKFIVKTDELQGLEEKNEARIRRLEDDDVFAVQDVLFSAPGANASGITTHIIQIQKLGFLRWHHMVGFGFIDNECLCYQQ